MTLELDVDIAAVFGAPKDSGANPLSPRGDPIAMRTILDRCRAIETV